MSLIVYLYLNCSFTKCCWFDTKRLLIDSILDNLKQSVTRSRYVNLLRLLQNIFDNLRMKHKITYTKRVLSNIYDRFLTKVPQLFAKCRKWLYIIQHLRQCSKTIDYSMQWICKNRYLGLLLKISNNGKLRWIKKNSLNS